MARNGTNLSQVFVANAILSNNEAFSALSSGEVGLFGNGTNVSDGAVGDVYVDQSPTGHHVWLKDKLQIAQGRASGNPIASPIINTSQITRVDWKEHVTAVKAGNTTTDTISNTNNSTRFAIKAVLIAVGPVNNYGEFIAPTNSKDLADRVGEVRNYEYVSDASATAAEICQGLVDAINADTGAFITASLANTSDFSVIAKDYGTVYRLIDDSDTAITVSAGAVTNIFTTHLPTEGVGNHWQVKNDEQKCQGKLGHHNRMYLPMTADTWAQTDWKYHCIDIHYKHNWPNSTGIAPAGEINVARIYIGDSSTAMIAGDTILDTILMDNAGNVTDKTILFAV